MWSWFNCGNGDKENTDQQEYSNQFTNCIFLTISEDKSNETSTHNRRQTHEFEPPENFKQF